MNLADLGQTASISQIEKCIHSARFLAMLEISSDPARLDFGWLTRTLQHSYWGEHLSVASILKACDHSLCLGAYLEGQQVGFLRIITDRAIISSVTDLIVSDRHQRKGVGTALMRSALAHPDVWKTSVILRTRDAAEFYAKFGFVPIGGGVMQLDPKA